MAKYNLKCVSSQTYLFLILSLDIFFLDEVKPLLGLFLLLLS